METGKYKVLPMVRRVMGIMVADNKKQVARMVVYTLIAGVYPFASILIPKIAIGIIEQGGEEVVRTLITALVAYFLIAGGLGCVMGYFEQVMQADNMRLRLRYLTKMCNKIQTMDYHYVEDSRFFEENDRAINSCNDNANGVEGIYNKIVKLPAKVLAMVGMLVATLALNPILVVVIVLQVVVSMWAAKQTHNYQYGVKEDIAKAERKKKYFKNTTNDFTFGKDIRIFNLRERIISNYRYEIQAFTELNKKVANKEFLYGMTGIVTLLITNVLMYGILIWKAYNGMPVSSFTMYIALINSLMAGMLEVGNDFSFIQNQGQYVDDYFKLMDSSLVEEGTVNTDDNAVEIVFDHVTFRYPNTDKDIFKDFSFTIKKGERLAIVGVNGAGKSTLIKLICGLYAVDEGHIYVNGKDINEYNKKELYKLYGTVFQDFNILAFTIKENVACTSEDIDEEKVMKALESVGLGNKVKGFSKGLDQMMLKIIDENGTDFSGGERQKLAIARALYKDAPMVIMDEPTAALDAMAEAEIYEGFSSLVEGKTAIYVSHRLASTRFCDKIALFDGTGVKEYGTHEELMEKKGMYYDMFVIQGKYYQENGEDIA